MASKSVTYSNKIKHILSDSKRQVSNEQPKRKISSKKNSINQRRKIIADELNINDFTSESYYLFNKKELSLRIHFSTKFSLELIVPSTLVVRQLIEIVSCYFKLHKKYAPSVNHVFSGFTLKNPIFQEDNDFAAQSNINFKQELVRFVYDSSIINNLNKKIQYLRFYQNDSSIDIYLLYEIPQRFRKNQQIQDNYSSLTLKYSEFNQLSVIKSKESIETKNKFKISPFSAQNIVYHEAQSYRGKNKQKVQFLDQQNIFSETKKQYRKKQYAQKEQQNCDIYIKQYTQNNQSEECALSNKKDYIKYRNEQPDEDQILSFLTSEQKSQNFHTFQPRQLSAKNSKNKKLKSLKKNLIKKGQTDPLKWLDNAQIVDWLLIKDLIDKDHRENKFVDRDVKHSFLDHSCTNQVFNSFSVRLKCQMKTYNLVFMKFTGQEHFKDMILIKNLIKRVLIQYQRQSIVQEMYCFTQNHQDRRKQRQINENQFKQKSEQIELISVQQSNIVLVLRQKSFMKISLLEYLKLVLNSYNQTLKKLPNQNPFLFSHQEKVSNCQVMTITLSLVSYLKRIISNINKLIGQFVRQFIAVYQNKQRQKKDIIQIKSISEQILTQLFQCRVQNNQKSTQIQNVLSLFYLTTNQSDQSQQYQSQNIFNQHTDIQIKVNHIQVIKRITLILHKKHIQKQKSNQQFSKIRIQLSPQQKFNVQKSFKMQKYFQKNNKDNHQRNKTKNKENLNISNLPTNSNVSKRNSQHQLIQKPFTKINIQHAISSRITQITINCIQQILQSFNINKKLIKQIQFLIKDSFSQIKSKTNHYPQFFQEDNINQVEFKHFSNKINELFLNYQKRNQYTERVISIIKKNIHKQKNKFHKISQDFKEKLSQEYIKQIFSYKRPQLYYFKPNQNILLYEKQTTLKKKTNFYLNNKKSISKQPISDFLVSREDNQRNINDQILLENKQINLKNNKLQKNQKIKEKKKSNKKPKSLSIKNLFI